MMHWRISVRSGYVPRIAGEEELNPCVSPQPVNLKSLRTYTRNCAPAPRKGAQAYIPAKMMHWRISVRSGYVLRIAGEEEFNPCVSPHPVS